MTTVILQNNLSFLRQLSCSFKTSLGIVLQAFWITFNALLWMFGDFSSGLFTDDLTLLQ